MPYDLNGRPEPRSRMDRLLRRTVEEITPEDPRLVPVAGSGDDAAASSAILDAAEGFDPAAQSVLGHVLELPCSAVDEVLRLAGQDGYVRVAQSDAGGRVRVDLARVQRIDALHVSQERSRMAGLAARHDGRVLLWQVLQIPG